jgi:formylmethanofuran dehydrogenase subunit B
MKLFTCRGCALLCQNVATGEFTACPKANFSPSPELFPQISGKPANLEQALQAAADLLRASRFPLLLTTGAAVVETRVMLTVAEKIQATVDLVGSAARLDTLHAWQTQRIHQTTLTELRQRADVVCVIGEGFAEKMPYFYRDFIAPKPQFSEQRRVVFIGETAPFENNLHLYCKSTQFPQILAILLALLKGKLLEKSVYELPEFPKILHVVELFRSANYGVITWLNAGLGENADLTQSMIYQLITYLAKSQRFTALSLIDNPENITFTQVSTWRTGFPFHYQFTEQGVIADNWKYDGARVLAKQESDMVLFVGDCSKNTMDFNQVPAIVFDTSGNAAAVNRAAVWVPVGKTGIDYAGQLFRADQGSVVNLNAFRENSLLPNLVAVLMELCVKL